MKRKFDQIIKNTKQDPEGKVEFLKTFILAVMDMDGFFHYILPTIEEIFRNNSDKVTILRIQSKY